MTIPDAQAVDRRRPAFGLSDRLRKARELAGMEKQELADVIGIHRDSIANYEAGRRAPRRPVVLAWALACDVDVDWLAGEGWAPWGSNPRPADYKFGGLVTRGHDTAVALVSLIDSARSVRERVIA